MAGTRRRSWSPTLSSSVGNLFGARLELTHPVPDRPQQHPLRTGLDVGGQDLRATCGRADREMVGKRARIPVEGGREHLSDHCRGFGRG